MARMKVVSASQKRANIAKANKKGLISKKASLLIYAVVFVLAVAARTVQLYSNMDFIHDRYIDPSPLKNYTALVLVPGIALLAFVLIAGSAKDKVIDSCILINPMHLRYDKLRKKIPQSAGFCSLAMALLVFAQIVFDFITLVARNTEIMRSMSRDEARYYSKLTGYNWGTFFIHLVMVFVILNFISIAVNIFRSEGITSGNCAALVFYSIWKLTDMFKLMAANVAISTSSELTYTMLSYVLAVLFFVNTARFFNGMEKKSTRFWMCFTGYTSSIIAGVSVIPRYILLLMPNGYEERLDMKIPSVSDIGIVFMPITIVAVFWTTYVYRVMPKLKLNGKRRWSRAPMNKEYIDIESIDVNDPNETKYEI